jgi:GTP-binding protein
VKVLSADFIKSCTTPDQFPPDGWPEVVCVGRSNVGKSSLINALAHRAGLAKVSRTPGKTRVINFFRLTVADSQAPRLFLVDLPGYGYAKVSKSVRAEWGPMIQEYLENRPQLTGLLFLVDVRGPSPLDVQTADWLQTLGLPRIVVATKVDQLARRERAPALAHLRTTLRLHADETVVPFSSKDREGRDALWGAIRAMASRQEAASEGTRI